MLRYHEDKLKENRRGVTILGAQMTETHLFINTKSSWWYFQSAISTSNELYLGLMTKNIRNLLCKANFGGPPFFFFFLSGSVLMKSYIQKCKCQMQVGGIALNSVWIILCSHLTAKMFLQETQFCPFSFPLACRDKLKAWFKLHLRINKVWFHSIQWAIGVLCNKVQKSMSLIQSLWF